MRYWLLLFLLLPLTAQAQTPGTCDLGTAAGVLDVGEVRAALFNGGNLFFGNEVNDGSGYVVPRGQPCRDRDGVSVPCSPVFAAALWVGGRVNGEVRTAAARYANFELWPGPLRDGAALPNPTDCSAYDRIFVVSRGDVARYLDIGEATADLRDWPYDLGAPVLDGDGIEGNYDLEGGDQPAIYGAQTAWWVMNDVGNQHRVTLNEPIGIEVQATAFSTGAGGPLALQRATYYRYRIVNRNTQPIDSAYVGLFVDADLGDAVDDYIGSDTTRSLGFVYNGAEVDAAYGVPPGFGVQVVQGPVGLANDRDDDGDGDVDEASERLGMTAFVHYLTSSSPVPMCGFFEKEEVVHVLEGRFCDGTPITEGGNGYFSGGPVTTFVYPGDPVTGVYWSEVNTDGEGTAHEPGDRRFTLSSGPFWLGPGEATEVVFAFPFAQGTGPLDSITELRSAADIVRNAWDTGSLAPSRVEAAAEDAPEVPGAVELSPPTPNPFTDRLTLRYTLPAAMPARITLLDVLGREVATLASGEQSVGPHEVELDTATLPAGLYLVRVEAGAETRTFSVVKAR